MINHIVPLTFLVLLTALLFLAVGAWAQDNGATAMRPPTVELASLTPPVTPPAARVATATRGSQATASPMATTGAIAKILIPTATVATMGMRSPLPTPTAPLTATTALTIDSRVAISVAQMAESLVMALQQPLDATAVFSLPKVITNTAPVTAIVEITTPSGALPPLPSTAFLPPVEITATVSSTQPALSDAPLRDLQSDGVARTAHVPILMYHYLSEAPADADIYRRDLSVSPSRFAAHLDRIHAEGYTVIRLYDLVAYLMQGTPLPSKAVVITFDDGYRDNYEHAFPLLQERGMTATFFVVMEFINGDRPEYMTWAMVKALADGGMTVEAHGVDHTTLRGRSRADLEFQALRSYETLQNALGERAHFISYPAGEFDEQTITVFQRAGYWAAVTTMQGATQRSDDLFRLPRVRIRGTTTPDELAALLALDW